MALHGLLKHGRSPKTRVKAMRQQAVGSRERLHYLGRVSANRLHPCETKCQIGRITRRQGYSCPVSFGPRHKPIQRTGAADLDTTLFLAKNRRRKAFSLGRYGTTNRKLAHFSHRPKMRNTFGGVCGRERFAFGCCRFADRRIVGNGAKLPLRSAMNRLGLGWDDLRSWWPSLSRPRVGKSAAPISSNRLKPCRARARLPGAKRSHYRPARTAAMMCPPSRRRSRQETIVPTGRRRLPLRRPATFGTNCNRDSIVISVALLPPPLRRGGREVSRVRALSPAPLRAEGGARHPDEQSVGDPFVADTIRPIDPDHGSPSTHSCRIACSPRSLPCGACPTSCRRP